MLVINVTINDATPKEIHASLHVTRRTSDGDHVVAMYPFSILVQRPRPSKIIIEGSYVDLRELPLRLE